MKLEKMYFFLKKLFFLLKSNNYNDDPLYMHKTKITGIFFLYPNLFCLLFTPVVELWTQHTHFLARYTANHGNMGVQQNWDDKGKEKRSGAKPSGGGALTSRQRIVYMQMYDFGIFSRKTEKNSKNYRKRPIFG